MTESQVSRCLCGRLSAIGLPNRLKLPILDEIKKWISCSGQEWTVARLKDLKVDLIRSWSGLEPVSKGIRYVNGAPKGPFRPLWSMTSPRGKFKAVQVLMAYTALVSQEVTRKQRSKFESSVTRSQVNRDASTDPYVMAACDYAREHITSPARYIGWGRVPDYDSYPWSSSKRQPTVRGKTVPEIGDGVSPYDPLHSLVLSPTFLRLYRQSQRLREAVPPTLKELFDKDSEFGYQSPVYEMYRQKFHFVDSVGKISFIQEPGYKLRAVANPLRIYQVALTPMKNALDSALKILPGVYVHDQLAGVNAVQSALNRGQKVHSVDLTDATNNFPLSIQEQILSKTRFPDKDAMSLFMEVSRSPWLYKDSQGRDTALTWSVGQPLGLAPSFASFTLAHACVVGSCQRRVTGAPVTKENACFAVVGDDVAIWDDRVAKLYHDFLQEWDVPISQNKSLESSRVAEFCGKVITKDMVIPQYKYRMVSDNSFVDIARNLGPQSVSLFTPAQRRVLKEIASVPEPIGGLGWNPKGESLDIRMSQPSAQALLSSYLESDRSSLFERDSLRINRHHYLCNWLNDRYVSVPTKTKERSQRPVENEQVVRHTILDTNQVSRESFRSDERPGKSWAPIQVSSDPRGPSTRQRLEKTLFRKDKGLSR